MKEYLNPLKNGGYELSNDALCEDSIEVPNGANKLTKCGLALYFWDTLNNKTYVDGTGWEDCDNKPLCTFESYVIDSDVYVIWQRETLSDKVASADVARQEEKTALDELLEIRSSDEEIKNRSAWDKQVGGLHYKDFAIQPMQFALANQLDYAQSNVIKYVTRHAQKNGKQDLLKAIHNIELMIEYYYPE